ncbi:hypothetical protein F53441_7407 [Fusarium austroafricanum]|uniref:Uncharacterized protein n=1 Tax=Fusarium austroafricanum TaxID=2364996 RepID=A0A8H4KHJ9_9HYPO|nr:hypothetical protein F53441_7407 [Fusarium austroafricanum]
MDPSDREIHTGGLAPDTNADAASVFALPRQGEDTNSNYLDSLDMSLLDPPDFDMSCLMDLDEPGELAPEQMPEPDSMMTDAPTVEPPGVIADVNLMQILTDTLVQSSDPMATSFCPVYNTPQPQGNTQHFQVGPDPMPSVNHQVSGENLRNFGNPSHEVDPFAHLMQTTVTPSGDPKPSDPGGHMFIQRAGPITQAQALPRSRRGGRQGPLTREQAEGQALARENGCAGGIPCKACLSLHKPRLWKGPCTKAQFLDIIDSGSFFFIRKTEAQLLKSFTVNRARSHNRLNWTREIAAICNGRCLDNPYEHAVIKLRSTMDSKSGGLRAMTSWLISRGAELHLFRYLQNAANNPSKDINEQKQFIYSVLFLLGHSFSISSTKIQELDTSHAMFQDSIKAHQDREQRVRLALWIYASISISQLPSETNFWKALPKELKVFSGGLPKRFRESFEGFHNSLQMNLKIELDSKKEFLEQLFFDRQAQHSTVELSSSSQTEHESDLWTKMILGTTQGINQIDHLNSGNPATLNHRVKQYEQAEAERLFLPQTQKQFEISTRRLFGTLLSLLKVPIRPEASFTCGGFEIPYASFYNLQVELLQFLRRFSSSAISWGMAVLVYGRDVRIVSERKHVNLNRWQELANLMGEGILLAGNTGHGTDELPHSFLDIEQVADQGTDREFSRLKELLRKHGSWLRHCEHFSFFCDERLSRSLECGYMDAIVQSNGA